MSTDHPAFDPPDLDAALASWAASQLPDAGELACIRAAILADGHSPDLPSSARWWLDLTARTNAIIAQAVRPPLRRLPAWS